MTGKLIYCMFLMSLVWAKSLHACECVERVLSKFEAYPRSRTLAEGFLCHHKSINFRKEFTSTNQDKEEAKFLFDILMKYQMFDIEALTPWDLENNYYKYPGHIIVESSAKEKWKVKLTKGVKSFLANPKIL